jgi:hypothetical protein
MFGGRPAPYLIQQFTFHPSKKGRFMRKKSRIEAERKIISRVKREMDEPRMTESVRNGFRAGAAPAVAKRAAGSARAGVLGSARNNELQFAEPSPG